jgi:hypothetical protein
VQGNCPHVVPPGLNLRVDAPLRADNCVIAATQTIFSIDEADVNVWISGLALALARASRNALNPEVLVNVNSRRSHIWMTDVGFFGDGGLSQALVVGDEASVYVAGAPSHAHMRHRSVAWVMR